MLVDAEVEEEVDVADVFDDVAVVVDVFVVELVVVGFTTVTAASWSSASARSQALVSFSQPPKEAPSIAQKTKEDAALGLDDQPGLRRDLACRGSLVFVIVSRYPACGAITTSMTTHSRPCGARRNPPQRHDTRWSTSFRRSRKPVRIARCTLLGEAHTQRSCSSSRILAPPRTRSTHVGRRWVQPDHHTPSRRFAHIRAPRRQSRRGTGNTPIARSHRHTTSRS